MAINPTQLVLTVADLGSGYASDPSQSGPVGTTLLGASYKAGFTGTTSTQFQSVASLADVLPSAAIAQPLVSALAATLARQPEAQPLPSPSDLGTGAAAYAFHNQVNLQSVVWVNRNILFDLTVGAKAPLPSTDDLLQLARIMNARAIAATEHP